MDDSDPAGNDVSKPRGARACTKPSCGCLGATRQRSSKAAAPTSRRQRIGLARAVGRPRLLVFDEPNSNLDAEGEQALIRAIAETKRTMQAWLSSPIVRVLGNVDKALVLRDGAVDSFGSRHESSSC